MPLSKGAFQSEGITNVKPLKKKLVQGVQENLYERWHL